uniref:Ovule protein n=1 Tax=Heterorhabditis bacteriophora TaxID=37862 RepID=A0A1I7W8V5_HETBA
MRRSLEFPHYFLISTYSPFTPTYFPHAYFMSNHRQGHGRGPPWGPLNRPNPFHHPVFPSSHGSASQFSVPPPITMPLMNLMGFPPPGPIQSNVCLHLSITLEN